LSVVVVVVVAAAARNGPMSPCAFVRIIIDGLMRWRDDDDFDSDSDEDKNGNNSNNNNPSWMENRKLICNILGFRLNSRM